MKTTCIEVPSFQILLLYIQPSLQNTVDWHTHTHTNLQNSFQIIKNALSWGWDLLILMPVCMPVFRYIIIDFCDWKRWKILFRNTCINNPLTHDTPLLFYMLLYILNHIVYLSFEIFDDVCYVPYISGFESSSLLIINIFRSVIIASLTGRKLLNNARLIKIKM